MKTGDWPLANDETAAPGLDPLTKNPAMTTSLKGLTAPVPSMPLERGFRRKNMMPGLPPAR
jgi:hypothetical protein